MPRFALHRCAWLLLVATLCAGMAQAQQRDSLWSRIKKAATAPEGQRQAGPQREAPGTDAVANIHALEDRFGGSFSATPFPGVYQREGDPDQAAVLVTRDAGVVINAGSSGLHRGPDGPRLTHAETAAFLRPLLPYLDMRRLIHFGGDGPLRMIVLSGIDCPYCKTLEAQLASTGVRYAVVPTAIMPENRPLARDAYCAADPARAWHDALLRGRRPPRATACEFDARYYRILAGLLGASTPRILYADGELAHPLGDGRIKDIKAKLASLSENGQEF